MRLVTFSHGEGSAIGVLRDHGVVALGAEAPATMEALLAAGADGMALARKALERGETTPLKDVKLHAPVQKPSKFLAIASNYQSHIDEVMAANPSYVPPTSQRWFAKLPSCINGPFDPIMMPPEGADLDYEVELAVIIGRRCRRVRAADARTVIAGYTVCNDVSVRDWQKRSPTIMLGKSFDTHGPLGPWIVTADEIEDPHALALTCTVNGEVRQRGSTSEMLADCFEQIAYLSTVCTLEPGDVIATGTPAGTGAGMKPPRLLKPGDVVRCEVERVGAIEARIVPEPV
ncbi:MAG TPA: fumarylacetoacetate hydrolase family protein [Caulobacterales bacterium]|nr:fumarylacetoacetate hydrolase family protein [Caulobacterales bacterium]